MGGRRRSRPEPFPRAQLLSAGGRWSRCHSCARRELSRNAAGPSCCTWATWKQTLTCTALPFPHNPRAFSEKRRSVRPCAQRAVPSLEFWSQLQRFVPSPSNVRGQHSAARGAARPGSAKARSAALPRFHRDLPVTARSGCPAMRGRNAPPGAARGSGWREDPCASRRRLAHLAARWGWGRGGAQARGGAHLAAAERKAPPQPPCAVGGLRPGRTPRFPPPAAARLDGPSPSEPGEWRGLARLRCPRVGGLGAGARPGPGGRSLPREPPEAYVVPSCRRGSGGEGPWAGRAWGTGPGGLLAFGAARAGAGRWPLEAAVAATARAPQRCGDRGMSRRGVVQLRVLRSVLPRARARAGRGCLFPALRVTRGFRSFFQYPRAGNKTCDTDRNERSWGYLCVSVLMLRSLY